MNECYSGWTILLALILIGVLNSATVNSGLLDLIAIILAIAFYFNQRKWTGCEYPQSINPFFFNIVF